MKVLFGTKNQSKRDNLRKLLQLHSIEVIGLYDLGIDIDVKEDGTTPEENAIKKAKAYYDLAQIPTFAVDVGLYIDKFPADKQPGLFVRRIWGDDREATDEQMIEYYISELKKVGGESEGTWVAALALITEDGVVTSEAKTNTLFKSTQSSVVNPGEPLNSIQYSTELHKYKSEYTDEEIHAVGRRNEKVFVEFLIEQLVRR